MNKTKVVLERVAAIITIVLGSFFLLGTLMILGMASDIEAETGVNIVPLYTVVLIISIALIVVGSLLCPTPRLVNGKSGVRFGLGLALAIMLGILFILEFIGSSDGIIYGVVFLVPFVLEVVSLCMRHPTPVEKPGNPNDSGETDLLLNPNSKYDDDIVRK